MSVFTKSARLKLYMIKNSKESIMKKLFYELKPKESTNKLLKV